MGAVRSKYLVIGLILAFLVVVFIEVGEWIGGFMVIA